MSRALKDYHFDDLLYRGAESVDVEREVVRATLEPWDFDWDVFGDGSRECWRVSLWGMPYQPLGKPEVKELALMATAVFPFDTTLVLGEREA